MSGDTKLCAFILDILMIDSTKWTEVSCPTLNTSVCLKHLKSVMNGLYERQHGGNAFHDLAEKFKKPLTSIQVDSLKRCGQRAKDLTILVNTLKDFLLKLQESSLVFEEYIKFNLPYIGDGLLDGCDWFEEFFPADLKLESTYETYLLLKGLL
jgi:hypothetical protein